MLLRGGLILAAALLCSSFAPAQQTFDRLCLQTAPSFDGMSEAARAYGGHVAEPPFPDPRFFAWLSPSDQQEAWISEPEAGPSSWYAGIASGMFASAQAKACFVSVHGDHAEVARDLSQNFDLVPFAAPTEGALNTTFQAWTTVIRGRVVLIILRWPTTMSTGVWITALVPEGPVAPGNLTGL